MRVSSTRGNTVVSVLRIAFLATAFPPFLAGCSGDSNTTVTGEVTLNNAPVACGVISFVPADGIGPSAQAVIEDGRYIAEMPSGLKTVTLEIGERRGTSIPVKSDGNANPTTIYEIVSPIEYHEQERLSHERDISRTANVHDFHLNSK